MTSKNSIRTSRKDELSVGTFVLQTEKLRKHMDCQNTVYFYYGIPDIYSNFSLSQLARYSLAPCTVKEKSNAAVSFEEGYALVHKSHQEYASPLLKTREIYKDSNYAIYELGNKHQ